MLSSVLRCLPWCSMPLYSGWWRVFHRKWILIHFSDENNQEYSVHRIVEGNRKCNDFLYDSYVLGIAIWDLTKDKFLGHRPPFSGRPFCFNFPAWFKLSARHAIRIPFPHKISPNAYSRYLLNLLSVPIAIGRSLWRIYRKMRSIDLVLLLSVNPDRWYNPTACLYCSGHVLKISSKWLASVFLLSFENRNRELSRRYPYVREIGIGTKGYNINSLKLCND